jgi:hypothetical protein
MYIFNLFGTGIRYWNCLIPNDHYHKMSEIKHQSNQSWLQLFFDFDFWASFGYYSWNDLCVEPSLLLFELTPQNRIEIKLKSKIIEKIKAVELYNDETLFPIFNVKESSINFSTLENHKQFIIVQHEIGQIGKYKLETNKFYAHELCFNLSLENPITENKKLISMYYEGNELELLSEDLLVRSTNLIEI